MPPPGAVYPVVPDWEEEHVLEPPGLIASRYPSGRRLTRGLPSFRRLDLMVCLVLREASCWAHLRRGLPRQLLGIRPNPRYAREAARPGRANSMTVERDISGQPAGRRYAHVQKFSLPKVERSLLVRQNSLGQSGKRAIWPRPSGYGLNRRKPFSLFLEDGRVAIRPKNPAERALPTDWESKEKKLAVCRGRTPGQKPLAARHDDH